MLASDMFDLATANYFSGELLPELVVGPWNGMVELGYTMALIGCVSALVRRVAFTPEKLKGKSQLEGNAILLLIFTITTTSFMIESKEDPSPFWEPIGYQFSEFGLADRTVVVSYWLHMLAISVFLFLIPLSKHILVQENDFVKSGMALCDGSITPLDILRIKGPTAVQEYIVNEVQELNAT